MSALFFFSHASAYTNHPDHPGSMFFDPDTMDAQLNNPGWVRGLEEYVKTAKFAPPNALYFSFGEVNAAMAGEPDIVNKVNRGYKAIGRIYKNHIDGFNLVPYLTGKEKKSPRNYFFYLSDDGDMLGLRYDNWKIVFMEDRGNHGRVGRSVCPAKDAEDLQS